jgi:hypothetical protein
LCEDLGDRTKPTQTMRFATIEERDTTRQYGVEEVVKSGLPPPAQEMETR